MTVIAVKLLHRITKLGELFTRAIPGSYTAVQLSKLRLIPGAKDLMCTFMRVPEKLLRMWKVEHAWMKDDTAFICCSSVAAWLDQRIGGAAGHAVACKQQRTGKNKPSGDRWSWRERQR